MGQNILIVEDEPEMLDMLKVIFEAKGYQAKTADDGEETLEKYKTTRPDLIIFDIMPPKLNGYEVCRSIRREKGDNYTRILMLTAKDQDSDQIIGKVIGAEEYLTKPFDHNILLEEIDELLAMQKNLI